MLLVIAVRDQLIFSSTRCFPVWTLLEIWVLAALLGIPAKKWVPRYVQVGGIPRNVLIDPVDVDSHLNGLDFDQVCDLCGLSTSVHLCL